MGKEQCLWCGIGLCGCLGLICAEPRSPVIQHPHRSSVVSGSGGGGQNPTRGLRGLARSAQRWLELHEGS